MPTWDGPHFVLGELWNYRHRGQRCCVRTRRAGATKEFSPIIERLVDSENNRRLVPDLHGVLPSPPSLLRLVRVYRGECCNCLSLKVIVGSESEVDIVGSPRLLLDVDRRALEGMVLPEGGNPRLEISHAVDVERSLRRVSVSRTIARVWSSFSLLSTARSPIAPPRP